MRDLESVRRLLAGYAALKGARAFFEGLGYPTIDPLPEDLEKIPQGAREAISSVHRIVHLKDGFPFRIFHVELRGGLRRTDIRRFLESYYRHNPTGENLFVFAPSGSADELAFVSPLRLLDPRDPHKVRLWLRILQVRREAPYRTDLEVLSRIRADGVRDPSEIWRRHQDAFSVQRVTEEFFRDYQEIFAEIQNRLARTHRGNGRLWARDYAHQLLNRIMFLYFIARKGWLQGPDGEPDRDFMRHFWEAYRGTGARDAFHRDWLDVLFFEAFNNRWQNRAEYQSRFPEWLRRSLSQAPFLNGGLYTRRPGLDDRLERWLPDEIFALLFEKWTDGAPPGFFERYNFTVVESGRFDEEVAVDPEMLGTVYERLVNVTFEGEGEDLRGAAGIFYTPRTEIDLMCRLALADWLGNRLGRSQRDLLYEWVFALSEDEKKQADGKVAQEGLWRTLNELVRRVRVCDPACGSGSFLVGMLLVLDDLQARCDRTLANTPQQSTIALRAAQAHPAGPALRRGRDGVGRPGGGAPPLAAAGGGDGAAMVGGESPSPSAQPQPQDPARGQPAADPGGSGPQPLPPGRAEHPGAPEAPPGPSFWIESVSSSRAKRPGSPRRGSPRRCCARRSGISSGTSWRTGSMSWRTGSRPTGSACAAPRPIGRCPG
jgi:hypothetical protein